MMQKMYALDGALLTNIPEVRIGDKCYPVDNRASTVKKLLKELKDTDKESAEYIDYDERVITAAFGKKAKEILSMDLPFAAQSKVSELALTAMTGDDVEPASGGDRFQAKEE